MKKDEIVNTIKNRNVRDYTYAIMFFVVSTFFAFFVIRPVLSIAITIQREAEDLERINQVYERNITKVLELQSQIEALRPRRHLIDEAIPSSPRVDAVIADIQRAAQQANIPITVLQIQAVELKNEVGDNKGQEEPIVAANLSTTASYSNIEAFLQAVARQRRVKSIERLSMGLNSGSNDEVTIVLEIELDSHYMALENVE